jgi:hypothetical protein
MRGAKEHERSESNTYLVSQGCDFVLPDWALDMDRSGIWK